MTRQEWDVECRHRWVWASEQPGPQIVFVCEGCGELSPECRHCYRVVSGSLAVCARCLGEAQRVLRDLREAIAQVPDPHATILGLRPLVGAGVPDAQDRDRLPHGLDAVFDDLEAPGLSGIVSPSGLLESLAEVADDWAEHRAGIRGADGLGAGAVGDEAPGVAPVRGPGVLAWLEAHVLWALQAHPAWADQLAALRAYRDRARHMAGLDPVAEPVPCVYCRGRVVREWTVQGLDDVARCTRCRTSWPTPEHLRFAERERLWQLHETHPDALVTVEDARRAMPWIKRNTLTQALLRDARRAPKDKRFPVRGKDVRGESLYRLGDLAQVGRREEATA